MTKNELKYFVKANNIETHFYESNNSVMFLDFNELQEFNALWEEDCECFVTCVLKQHCVAIELENFINIHLTDEFENDEEIEIFIKELERG